MSTRIVLVLLVLLGALVVAVEVAAPRLVARGIEDGVDERTRGVTTVRARVDSFPVVARVLGTGQVRHVSVELDRVARQELTFATIRMELEGVRVGRRTLLGGEVEIQSIERGRIAAELTAEALSAALPVASVELGPGVARVAVGGAGVDVALELQEGRLRFAAGPLPELAVPLPVDVLPCEPEGEVLEGRILLTCTVHDVPPVLVRAVSPS